MIDKGWTIRKVFFFLGGGGKGGGLGGGGQMQNRFAQDNFSKKSLCIATNTQKKFQKVFVKSLVGLQQHDMKQ